MIDELNIDDLTDEECTALTYDYELVLREKQKLPDLTKPWRIWLILAGRGFGKTHAGAMAVNHMVNNYGYRNVALVGPDAADVRGTMITKQSGIVNVCPPWDKPKYNPSIKTCLRWNNGAIGSAYSAEDPEGLRGENSDLIWMDELCSWKYLDDTYTQAILGNRIGEMPRIIITTTPKPSKLLRKIMEDPEVIITTGSTFENSALAKVALETYRRLYEGTTIGKQELYAEVLDLSEGAMFKLADIEAGRIRTNIEEIIKTLTRIVVAIDPAVTNNENSDETGIVVAGKDGNGHGYILYDGTMKGSPDDWGREAVRLFHKYKADRIIAETNQGGDMVERVIQVVDKRVPYKSVRATRGKQVRAEPIAALYEQHKIHHLGTRLGKLEEQMTEWIPGDDSPDRMDAMVWALTELMLGKGSMTTGKQRFGI